MPNILTHLNFLLTATNHHGVHSPFIYNYVTQCLYAEPEYCRKKSQNILFKSIAYFKSKRVWLPPGKGNLKNDIQRTFPRLQFEKGPYDILFIHPSEAEKLIGTASKEPTIHNDSLVLIEGIYGNHFNLSLWEKIKHFPRVTVTVDLFYCGAVFLRKEQAKEHFKIRI